MNSHVARARGDANDRDFPEMFPILSTIWIYGSWLMNKDSCLEMAFSNTKFWFDSIIIVIMLISSSNIDEQPP